MWINWCFCYSTLLQVQLTILQVEEEVKLEIPDMPMSGDAAEIVKNTELVIKLEHAMDAWGSLVSATVDEQLLKQPQGRGPLAIIDYWKEINSSLSALYEQLRLPSIQKVVKILKLSKAHTLSTFEVHCSELNKYYLEAKDNVKFLSTLERHFKNITHGSNFTIILETLPGMMNSLRMVWVISRYYNTDERMVPLMERIAWELCERVARVVNTRTIFRYTACIHKLNIKKYIKFFNF